MPKTHEKDIVKQLGFSPKENESGVFCKKYKNGHIIEIDFENEAIIYGEDIKYDSKTTQNFSQAENFVILECVNRLLEKGYKPKDIVLEKTYPSGHGTSGRLDICVTRDDGSEYLLIECKTYGKEFDKEFTQTKKDGGQLFTYFKFSNKADVIMLYTSELKGKEIIYRNEIIKIEDGYRTGDVKDFYEKWNKLTKDNGVFDTWVKPYNFESKAITKKQLKEIRSEDSSFIFNSFLEILRHNVVSDKPNAFNKIFTLFLCKVYDEKTKKENEELKFQWLEGIDKSTGENAYIDFLIRLTDLYQKGMLDFLEKQVTDFSEEDFNKKYGHLNDDDKKDLLREFIKIRLEKNNEFAIKEVFDNQSFLENAKIVKEVVELLQNYKIRYNKRQQYLSDFFELLLTTGLKQESGQFFTPVPIAQFIIKSLPIDKFVNIKLEKGENNNLLPFIIDFAAGSGHFLTESMHEIQRLIDQKTSDNYISDTTNKIKNWQNAHFDWATQYVYGIEKDYRLVKVGKVGCYLHGDGLANVILSDGLANFKNPEYKEKLHIQDKDFPKENKQFDIVISNPPYSVSAFRNAARDYYTENDFELYNDLTDNSSEIECLFVERTKQLLKDEGVAGIILPSSILNNEGIYTKAREIILKYFEIVAITELGNNTFMATGTNTVVLFIRRRNNYDCKNFVASIENSLKTYQDNTINGIEKPIAKYVNQVWKSISFKDYITLLKREPNENIKSHEIYKEYGKKIKFKTEKDFWDKLVEIEKEKVLYFILAYPQKVVLIKTGEKDAEKRFLGYEFSYRRGSEGIHPIQRGKTIDECTKLFDDERFDNEEKASTYIYKAFSGDYKTPIHESLKNNVFRVHLVEMLTFDRTGFAKNISTAVKKKVKIESKWDVVKIGQIATAQYGFTDKATDKGTVRYLRITDLNDDGTINLTNEPKFINPDNKTKKQFLLKNKDIVIARSGSVGKSAFYESEKYENMIFASYLICVRTIEDKVLPEYLFHFTKTQMYWNQVEANTIAVTQPNLNAEKIKEFQVPLPSKEIQKKIVSKIEMLEKKEAEAKKKVDEFTNLISTIISKITGEKTKLQNITIKIGSGATPLGGEGVYKNTGISFIRSQNIYDDGFVKEGLAYIDEEQAKKLNNVIVEKNDILFNITGASIARCCIVDAKYLPARVNQHVSIIRIDKKKVIAKYVQQMLISTEYKNQLLQIGDNATSREAITKSQLENFEIPIPSLSEQQKIVAEIEKIEVQIQNLQKELEQLSVQKKLVLEKYL
jgi:type I restriction enzyme M protein